MGCEGVCGGEGDGPSVISTQSDLKVVTDAKGNGFYRDHLPLLGEDREVWLGHFEVGNHVCVEVEVDVMKTLQSGHGGWTEGMREVSGWSLGRTHEVVIYPS